MIEGYILLPKESSSGYFGIDRGLFEPELIQSEFDYQGSRKNYPTISSFYPPGWRKSAYALFEENEVKEDDNFALLKDYAIALKLKELILPHLGEYDIFYSKISDDINSFQLGVTSFGYDFAYKGGDYYSSILNGLFINRSERLYAKYNSQLNDNGLFSDPTIFESYIHDFKIDVQSEAESNFSIYLLIKK